MVAKSRELDTLNELFSGLELEEELIFSPEQITVIQEQGSSRSNKNGSVGEEFRLNRGALSEEKLELGLEEIEELDELDDLDLSKIQLTSEDWELPSQKSQKAEDVWEDPGEMTAAPKNARQGKNPKSKKQKSEESSNQLDGELAAMQSQTLAEVESEDFDDLLAIGGKSDGQSENWDVLEPLESDSSQSQEILESDLELELEPLAQEISSEDLELELELEAPGDGQPENWEVLESDSSQSQEISDLDLELGLEPLAQEISSEDLELELELEAPGDGQPENWEVLESDSSQSQEISDLDLELELEPLAQEISSEDLELELELEAPGDGQPENWDVLEPLESDSSQSQEISDLDLELELEPLAQEISDLDLELELEPLAQEISDLDLELELELEAPEDGQPENWDVLEPLESDSSQSQQINDLELELELEAPEGSSEAKGEEPSLESANILEMEDLGLGLEAESMLSDLELEMSSASGAAMEVEELSLDSLEELETETQNDTSHSQGEEPSLESGAQAEMPSMEDLGLGLEAESMLSDLELEMSSASGAAMEVEELSLDSLEELETKTQNDTSHSQGEEPSLESGAQAEMPSMEDLGLGLEAESTLSDLELEMSSASGAAMEVEELSLDSLEELETETERDTSLLQDIDLGEESDLMWDVEGSEAADGSELPLDMDGDLLASAQSTDDIEAMLSDFSGTGMDATEALGDDFDFDSIDLDLDGELLGDRVTSPKNVTDDVLDWDLFGDLGVDRIGEQTEDIPERVTDVETGTVPEKSEGPTPPWEELEALLGDEEQASLGDTEKVVFDRLEEFLNASEESLQAESAADEDTESGATNSSSNGDEFDELQAMLEDADKLGGPSIKLSSIQRPQQISRPRPLEQNMKVPIKQLDNLSNLVGELVVNRNSLEQDQDRLRTTLDNLLYQVQQLNDVGGRMQDLYERSLLEASLLSSRASNRSGSTPKETVSNNQHHPGEEFDFIEMDSFTAFHLLSQEMIELIVRVRESASDIEFIVDETDQVTRQFRQVTTQLQEGLTRTRMVPFAQTVDNLPVAVKRICMQLNKQAKIQIEGRETLIDKMIQEHLSDPMKHLINNAMTHGVESPEVRETAGKPTVGQITVRAFHQGNQTVISVSDDGAGIDAERVKNKAIEKGLISLEEAKTISRLDLYDLLFHPGFSTKDKVGDLAGRGVGLDVVRTSLRDIRGGINIDSTLGKGTTFTIRLPLTLSISKALCCISNWAKIAFPMDGVEDMLDVPKERISVNSEGQSCIMWRDTQLPFQPLSELLQYNRQIGRARVFGANEEEDIVSIVVLRGAGEYIALMVDRVLGEQEIVIKQLEGPVPKPMGVAGATVLGDSRIMPIADVLELIDLSKGRSRRERTWHDDGKNIIEPPPPIKTETTVLIVDDSITVRELLSMTFNKAGYRVEQARDGQDAWDKLRSGLSCDLIFCDMEMPRMNGLELLERLQKDEHLDRIPMAMLTSRGAEKFRQKAANLGAKGYFTKPYLEEALLEAAQQMLKGEVLMSAAS